MESLNVTNHLIPITCPPLDFQDGIYDLRTKPLAQPSQQRRDIWGDPDCAGCGFVASTLAPQDILMPGGSPIGTYRKNPQIRTVANVTELNRIYNALTVDATPINAPSYNGQ